MRKITRTICTEEMVSRMPSLFAYCEFDELNVLRVHKATDSIDGSYGHFACGVKPPCDLTLKFDDEIKYIALNGECISYRTLMNYYFQAKSEGLKRNRDNSLIKFVEKGIGLVEISVHDIIVKKNGNGFDIVNEEGENTCKKWEFLYKSTLGCVPDEEATSMSFIFDVEPTMIEEKIYLSQAKKLYNEMVKIKKLCLEYEREKQDTPDVKEPFETKNVCCICDVYEKKGGDTMVNLLEFLIEEAEQTANEYLGYACLDKTSFNVSFDLFNTYNDAGYYTPYLLNWKPGQVIHGGEKFIFENEEGIMTMYQNDSNEKYYGHYDEYNERVVFDKNDVTEVQPKLANYDSNGTPLNGQNEETNIEIIQKTDSKLKSLRRYTTYTNEYGEPQKPEENEDWLYFYTLGMVRNLKTKNDEFGNIGFYGDVWQPLVENNYVVNLMAYGDIITDIVPNQDENTITFSYITGAHLKAQLVKTETDDDGNELFYYENFTVDNNSAYSKNCGITYSETYVYEEDSPLSELISNQSDFIRYIKDEDSIKRFTNEVFAFYTGNSKLSYDKQIDTKTATIDYLNTDMRYVKTHDIDVYNADIFKEDYLMGIHFKPNIEDNVDINRGKNAAFERHIKLGEVKTLQDLENYQNGGFYNIKEY